VTRYAIQTYAAFQYYPKGRADDEDKARLQRILYAIKNGGTLKHKSGEVGSAPKIFCDVLVADADVRRKPFLNSQVALVPLPSSTGLGMRPASQWPCLELAQHLQLARLGTSVPAVLRTTVIPTSHKLPSDQRPSVEMIAASVEVQVATIQKFPSVTLIDDVVSSGSNAIGVMIALQRAGYRGAIRLFAAAHTVGNDGLPEGPFYGECIWLDHKPRAFRPAMPT
jgi:hypothetical protein